MLKPSTETISTAGKFVSEATSKQQSGDLRGALKNFTSASNILKSELERISLESRISSVQVDPAQYNFVTQYIQQLNAQAQALETAIEKQVEDKIKEKKEAERQAKLASAAAASSSNSTTPNSATTPTTSQPPSTSTSNSTTGNDIFGGISIPKHTLDAKKVVPSAPPSTTSSNPPPSAPSKPTSSFTTPSSAPNNNSNPPPSKKLLNTSELDKLAFGQSVHNTSIPSSNYAPRASDIVYKAIDHATKLAASHQYKTAADVIQHAYEVGCREDHRPKNLEKLPLFAKELRSKHQSKFPPRIPQDNARTNEENEVLRSAGRTTRMLLSEWDDVDEGFVAENIWMPGRSDQAFQDDFIPRMAPDQMKFKPRFLRFSDVMAYHDKFDELVRKHKEAANSQQRDQEEDGTSENPQEQQQQSDHQSNPPQHQQQIIANAPDPMTIKQTVVSDCSLVCSLIVTANYERRFPGSRLIRSAIFPQDDTTGEPIVNRKGKYCVKMLINGTTRVIAIDDRFPAAGCEDIAPGTTKVREPELLCSQTVTRGEMWVSLMEKAFIKVSGGSYDFPGSNSSNDLYRLSGWLPDVLRFPNTGQKYGANFDHEDAAGSKEKPFDADFQWRRLSTCHARGAVVLTIATPSQLPQKVEERLKLIPGHAYAVLDFKETCGYRLVKVKNPWSSQPWEGLFGIDDVRKATQEILQALNHGREESERGVFWATWQDVVTFFAVAHLSWNPYSLYPSPNQQQKYFKPTRLARHAKNISTTSGGGEAPQFQIFIPPSLSNHGVVGGKRRFHLVLSRHITNDAEYEENELLAAASNTNHQQKYEAPFITVHVYDTTSLPSLASLARSNNSGGGEHELWRNRIASLDGSNVGGGRRLKTSYETGLVPCLHRGVYSNSAATTHSFDCPGNGPRELTCVVARLPPQSGPNGSSSSTSSNFEPFSFSLTLYSNLPYQQQQQTSEGFNFLSMPPLKSSLRHRCVVPGEWVAGQNCGGAFGSQTFTFNPQYTFKLNQDSHILAELLSPMDSPVNLVICKISDNNGGGGAKWFEDLNVNPPWCIRVDRLHSLKHPVVLRAKYYSKFGACIDSSLADCVAIGDTARAPVVSSSPTTSSNPNETTDPNAPLPSAAIPNKKTFTSIHQLIHSLSLDVKVSATHGPASVFTTPLKDHLFLSHIIASCPISTWIVPLLLSKNHLVCHNLVEGTNNNSIQSKIICGGTSLTWQNVLNQSYLQAASVASGEVLTLTVVTSTESLPRTNELIAIEKNLIALATNAIEILKIGSGSDKFSQSILGVNDTIEKQIIALDGCNCTTDDIRKTKSVLIRAAQEIHKFLDFASKNPAPAYQPLTNEGNNNSSNSTTSSGGETTKQQQKENPLRSILTIPAGRYVLVATGIEKGKAGPFSVSLECEEEPVELRPLPAEGAGWRCPNPSLTSAWIGESAAGRPQQGEQGWNVFKKNPTVQISVGGTAQLNKEFQKSPAQKLRVFCRLLAIPPPGTAASTTPPRMQMMMFKSSITKENAVAHSGSYSSDGDVVLKTGIDDDEENGLFGVTIDFASEYFIVMSTYGGSKDSGWKCALKLFVANDNRGVVNAKVL